MEHGGVEAAEVELVAQVFFKIIGYVMAVAPIGAFGGSAAA